MLGMLMPWYRQVSSILFAPAQLLSLFPLAVDTALIVDVGHSETTVMAVYGGTPIISSFVAVPAAAAAVHTFVLPVTFSVMSSQEVVLTRLR